jgi:hypothetical protein
MEMLKSKCLVQMDPKDIQIKRLPQNIVQEEIKKVELMKNGVLQEPSYLHSLVRVVRDCTFLWSAANDVDRGRVQFKELKGLESLAYGFELLESFRQGSLLNFHYEGLKIASTSHVIDDGHHRHSLQFLLCRMGSLISHRTFSWSVRYHMSVFEERLFSARTYVLDGFPHETSRQTIGVYCNKVSPLG